MFILNNRSVSSLKNTTISLPFRLFSSIENQSHKLLSIIEISHLEDMKDEFKEEYFNISQLHLIIDFLKSLDENTNYVLDIEFVSGYDLCNHLPVMVLDRSILINRLSSSTLLIKHINDRLEDMVHLYFLDNAILHEEVFASNILFRYYSIKELYV
jgi:hypothetical protein